MLTFKVNSGITKKTSAARNKAASMVDGYSKPDKGIIFGIKSINSFIKEEESLNTLLKSYKRLVYKDTLDVEHMVEEVIEKDKIKGSGWNSSATKSVNGRF